jgi:DNA replication protein DnaC
MDKNHVSSLPLLLKELALPTFGRLWKDFCLESDTHGWGSARCLTTLCEHELAERNQRRIARYLREAQLPKGKSLATFDFGQVPSIDKTHIHALASGDVWLENGNKLVYGATIININAESFRRKSALDKADIKKL